MRVLIIADESFSSREKAMLTRLEIGLADEGVRVIRAVPASARGWHGDELSATAVVYADRGFAASRRWRARRLVEAVRGIAGDGEPPVDLVHAFGIGCWPMAQETARQAGAALAFDIDSAQAAGSMARLRPASGVGSTVSFLPDAALEALVRAGDVGVQIRVTPWGVHTPPTIIRTARESLTVMIAGSGSDAGAFASVVHALAELAPSYPELLVFADEQAVRQAAVWPLVQKLRLADRFTIAPHIEARRELTLRSDILIIPEARGEQRTLTLDAMAAGMVVLAAQDPYVSVLIDGRTARLVRRPEVSAWKEALAWALDRPEASAQLGASAREHVRQHCRASAHIASVLGSYEWMLSGAPIPFTGGAEVR